MGGQTHQVGYEFGDFRVDVRQRALLLKPDGRPLPLTSRAFDTLLFFLEHPGELLDKSALMKAVWPNVIVEENNLNQHISALRRVLGERPDEHRFIVTIPGRGYRFVAAVQPIVEGVEPAPAAAPADPAGAPAAALAPDPTAKAPAAALPPRQPPRRLWAAIAASAIVLAAGLAWYVTHSPAKHPATSLEVVPVRKPRLAVMPFDNLSPDANNAFFADALHEEILSTIAEEVPGVDVISRTTMMSYRTNPPKPLAVVAHELGASHLIEGSVRREGDKIRLTLQLIDAHTDDHLWSRNYDRTLADTLTLESQVAEEVAGQLSVQLLRSQPPGVAAVQDTQTFDLYLKAILALRDFDFVPGQRENIENLLGQIIARQPTFARAYAQRARLWTLVFISGSDTSEAFVDKIRRDLDTARRLAPKDPLVLASTGYFLMCTNDTTGALAAYDAAEAAGLADPEFLIPKAHLLLRRSRIQELDATTQRMLSLDPADPLLVRFAVYHLMRAVQPLEALRALEYARPYPPVYDEFRGYIFLEFGGRTQEMRAALEHWAPPTDTAHLADALYDYFQVLSFENRFTELRAHIDRVPVASALYLNGVDFGPIGPTPTALFRGWADMLLGDRREAEKDGRAVLEFAAQQPRTRWNNIALGVLSAEGLTFEGQCERARDTARSSLAQLSRADSAVMWNTWAMYVASVYAWCGGEEDAVDLLRKVSSGRPGVGPALVARNPLYTQPLGTRPAYQALQAQLESEIRRLGLDSGPHAESPNTAR
ncbi:MAG TPA: winged helix-turn-helix domain-containing protein [Steroidobacteraceae bacterium]|nr:winged helix-turn-helix domain-containing protein [Steroidobacteraceae bacterium]